MKYITLFVAAIMLIATAQARLGETLEESITRYGKKIKSVKDGPTVWHLFYKTDYLVGISLNPQGKTWAVRYVKVPKKRNKYSAPAQYSELDGREIQNFLKAEGVNWKVASLDRENIGDKVGQVRAKWVDDNLNSAEYIYRTKGDPAKWAFELLFYDEDYENHVLNGRQNAIDAKQKGF